MPSTTTNSKCSIEANNSSLRFVVVGAGIGGLTFAIACRRANPLLRITVLEKVSSIAAIGAGIHIPPNACRILTDLGLLDHLKQAGGYEVQDFTLRRYENGKVIVQKSLEGRVQQEYGAEWLAIHRGDYQNVLLNTAVGIGAEVVTDADVADVQLLPNEAPLVVLKNGRRMTADGVNGADGLWSTVRAFVSDTANPLVKPHETGDLAYRATFSREQLSGLDDKVDSLLESKDIQVWLGPNKHAVFYPLRDSTEYNLVLIVMDDLPEGVSIQEGTPEEMASNFDGWDPVLTKMISRVSHILKWKLLHLEALDQWTQASVALLGDASHPPLPYQGQGAAMAVEDGAVLATLVARLQDSITSRTSEAQKSASIAAVFKAYQQMRKARAELNVEGAKHTRHYYHLRDGEEQVQRDADLAALPGQEWKGNCSFNWGDDKYQKNMLGFDVVADAKKRIDQWSAETPIGWSHDSSQNLELRTRGGKDCEVV